MSYADSGKLYIVSTPIGNLADVTARSIEVLESVDLILSEDTRQTDKLLRNLGINNSQIPYTDQKHDSIKDVVLNKIKNGQNIALVSDSGTPLISDPGFKLVRFLMVENVEIVSIPGPSALISALTVSGLPTDNFIFLGFLPKSSKKRKDILKEYGAHNASLVIYESPKKIKDLLKEVKESLGNRHVSLIKDITKKFEKVITKSVSELINLNIKEKGEYVVIIAKESYKLDG